MPRSFEGDLSAAGLRVAIVASRFNDEIVSGLLNGALECLTRHGAAEVDVELYRVPGAFEIPLMARGLAASGRFNAVICLGCLIKGDTMHFEYLAEAVSQGHPLRGCRHPNGRPCSSLADLPRNDQMHTRSFRRVPLQRRLAQVERHTSPR